MAKKELKLTDIERKQILIERRSQAIENYKFLLKRDLENLENNESYFKTRSDLLVGICKYIDDKKEYYINKQILPPEIKD